jgi:hypothetical protein
MDESEGDAGYQSHPEDEEIFDEEEAPQHFNQREESEEPEAEPIEEEPVERQVFEFSFDKKQDALPKPSEDLMEAAVGDLAPSAALSEERAAKLTKGYIEWRKAFTLSPFQGARCFATACYLLFAHSA